MILPSDTLATGGSTRNFYRSKFVWSCVCQDLTDQIARELYGRRLDPGLHPDSGSLVGKEAQVP